MAELNIILSIIGEYWWVILPFFALGIFWELWREYADLEFSFASETTYLEIRLPREYKKSSMPAMDHVIAAMYHLHKDLIRYEIYVEGQYQKGYALEIAGDEGEVRFYIASPKERARYVTAEIYAQFPEAEVQEVEDYAMTKVPLDALTAAKREWDAWGTEFFLVREDPYPMRTYVDMALEKESPDVEAVRVDPLTNIIEALASTGPGEHFWYQIVIKPEIGWEKESQKMIDKIAGKEAAAESSVLEKSLGALTTGVTAALGGESEEEKKEEKLQLTWPIGPQYDEMKAIDQKRSKLGYRCTVRALYLAKKAVYNKRHAQGMLGFFRPFVKYNSLKTDKRAATTVDYFFAKFREESRKRNLLWRYRLRAGRSPGFILNTEELATLYHFPGREVATAGIQRVPTKKAVAPRELPVMQTS